MSFSAAARTSRKGRTVVLFQRICCFLFMRLATISRGKMLRVLSAKAVGMHEDLQIRGRQILPPHLISEALCAAFCYEIR